MNHVSRRRFLKITGAGAGVAATAVAFGSVPGLRASKGPVEKGIRTVPTFCDLCFWKCGAIATVRDGVSPEDRGQPRRPALARPALPARHRRHRAPTSTPTGSASRSCAPACAARRSGRGHLGRGARARRREDAEDQGRARPGGRRPLQPRLRRRRSSSTRMKAYGIAQLGGPVLRPVPRPARRRLRAHLRRGGRLARAHRHRERPLPRRSSARTWARTCTTPRCRSSPTRSAAAPTLIVVDPRFSVAAGKAKH